MSHFNGAANGDRDVVLESPDARDEKGQQNDDERQVSDDSSNAAPSLLVGVNGAAIGTWVREHPEPVGFQHFLGNLQGLRCGDGACDLTPVARPVKELVGHVDAGVVFTSDEFRDSVHSAGDDRKPQHDHNHVETNGRVGVEEPKRVQNRRPTAVRLLHTLQKTGLGGGILVNTRACLSNN